jgi:hypothetical protein
MRRLLSLSAVLLAIMVAPAQGHFLGRFSGVAHGLVGNDTGGIIPWSPYVHPYRHDIAAMHCARYNKAYRITSVHARYGDYIGFVCFFPRGYDPMKLYAYPPVRVLY